jgi:hypothetical protein
MSNTVNSNLFERTAQVIDDLGAETPSRDIETLERLMKANDLVELERKVTELEGALAQEHFHNLSRGIY